METTPKIFDTQIAAEPDYYPWAQQFIDSMHDGHWTVKKFDFSSDVHDFKTKLNEQERESLVRALSAIGQIEIAVKQFWAKLGDNCPHPSLIDLGYVLANVEVIHNKAYKKLLLELDLKHVFHDNLKLDIIHGRVNYLRKYTHRCYADNKQQYIYAVTLFSLFIENVSLFSQFYIAMWFAKEKNAFKNLSTQIDYTRKEETIHALVGIKLINTFREEYPELFTQELTDRIISEAKCAYEAEAKIIDWETNGLSERDMNAAVLKNYIKNRINESLELAGFPKAFFDIDAELLKETIWMEEKTLGNTMTDFFHKNPTEYAHSASSYDVNSLFDDEDEPMAFPSFKE